MKIEYALIATLRPPGLRDLAPMRLVISMLELVLKTPLMARMLGVRTRRDLKLYRQQLADDENYNFCLRFKAWVKADTSRIKWVRKVIGEANIRKWERRLHAAYLAKIMQDIARDEYDKPRIQGGIYQGQAYMCPLKGFLRNPIYTCNMRKYNRFMAGYQRGLGDEVKPRSKPIKWKPFGLVSLGLSAVANPVNLAPLVPKLSQGLETRHEQTPQKQRDKRSFTPITFYPHELRDGVQVMETATEQSGENFTADVVPTNYALGSMPNDTAGMTINDKTTHSRDGP